MIAGINHHFESLTSLGKRKFLIEQFPSWFHEGSFHCAGFLAWASTQPAAIRNSWLRALPPTEVAAVIGQLGIWGKISSLQQTHDKKAIHAFLEDMLPFWYEDGKFDAIGFDAWYQRAKEMDAQIVFRHLMPAEQKTVLNQWAWQMEMKKAPLPSQHASIEKSAGICILSPSKR